MNYFITATDTNAGKTYVTALLTRAFRKLGLDTLAMKPIACGDWSDSKILQSAAGNTLTLEEITPVYCQTPLAPIHAAQREGKLFSIDHVLPAFHHLRKKTSSLLVEGVGGWLALLSPTESLADLACAIQFPILLVVRNRLGAMNHALLTLESIKHHGCHCAGIILNHHPDDEGDLAIEGYRHFFKELSQERKFPIFLEVEPGQEEISILSL
ncbi:MAG: dethiobiotin synthase [Chthoniobacterales bacterium]